MKKPLCLLFVCLLAFFFGIPMVFGDTLVKLNNGSVSGTAIQTNGDDVLVLMDYAAFNFSKANLTEIKTELTEAVEFSSTNRFPDFKRVVLFLSKQPWATNLSPIPATVIDKGILRNVPYTSFRCGEDYEVNIYGDLNHPAGFEIGVYRKLLTDDSAKNNCVKFISSLLSQSADKEIMQGLDLKKDLKTSGEWTFEITPPTADDAYNGWWVSVYSDKQLNLARASDSEMNLISMTQTDAAKDVKETTNYTSWSAEELKLARPSSPTTITFTDKSGTVISNAEVVHINDGVSLIWRKNHGATGGLVRLEDLPDELQVRFGYDPAKTAAADRLASEKETQWQQDQALAAQVAQESQTTAAQDSGGYSQSYSSDSYSGGGSVYVHGYYRSNGTYVNAYTRSYPHR